MALISHKLLLVEDVILNAKITEQMLKKSAVHRYAVVHESTLAGAIAALKIDEFSAMLIDLNLPDSEGLGTLEAFLKAAPDVPAIVLTASNAHETGFEAVKLGAQDFLVKGDFNYLGLDRAILFAIERHKMQWTIRQLAVVDELTSLYNRRGFNALHGDIIEKVRKSSERGYLIFFDLDRFKQINDQLGHQKGDEALVEFAKNLRSIFRTNALVVRLGGDEFVVMGVEVEPGQVDQALQILEITLSVRNRPGAADFLLEASSGVVYFDASSSLSIEELSASADAALYTNKERRHAERAAEGAPAEARSR
jgi:diguanylate cyclase (GGDEF)-like protein